ncbi:MAG: GNAT family N-acetyltransferase [Anaerolineae bacterium]|nr:GNAT family N-acetyltransferase [Anaerolineae bacterium]
MIQPFVVGITTSLHTLFNAPHLGFMVEAMQAGNSPAAMWVDDVNQPRSAFIWDTTHSLYLGGDARNAAFVDDVRTLLADTILPHGHEKRLGVFKIYTANEAWAALVPELFQVTDMLARDRSLLRLDPEAVDLQMENALPGFRVKHITPELLQNRQNADRVLEEIGSCWTAIDRFWEQGFGFCALAENGDIAGWCTAEYVNAPVCGVGIETVEDYQGRGVGTLVARAFARHCVTNGWTAHWDSWTGNIPSVTVGQKAGFRKLLDYTVQIYVFGD